MPCKVKVEHKASSSIDALFQADRELQIFRDMTGRGAASSVAAPCLLQKYCTSLRKSFQ